MKQRAGFGKFYVGCFGVLLLGFSTFSACAMAQGSADGKRPSSDQSKLIAAIAAKLSAEYVYPDVGKAMANALSLHAAKGDYNSEPSAEALAEKLTADLRDVSHDKHVGVEYHPESQQDESFATPTNEDLKSWRQEAAKDNFAFDKVERMEGNVGYIKFRSFMPPSLAAETASVAMSFVANTDALIHLHRVGRAL